MAHPTLDAIVAGAATAHVGRCEPCRRLAALAGVTVAAAAGAALDPATLVVDDALYTDWAPLAEGRGGMGQVFRARDRRLDREVAIKQLATDLPLAARAELVRRFEREARVTARLQHPAIVGVHEAGRFADGEPFFAMPLLRGVSLATAIERRTTLAARLGLLANLTTIAEALAYAHEQGIVHRDVKPDNIIVGEFGETVLVDWGLAKDIRDPDADPGIGPQPVAREGLTQLGVGTAHYMPPEQARGEAPDPRFDVYALGATLYHAIAGHPPFAGDRATRVRHSLSTNHGPPSLRELVPEAPAELADIVARATAHDPAQRYASARELAAELHRFQTGQLLTSRRYSLGELVRHFARRHRTAIGVGLAALAVLVAVGAWSLARVAHERDRAQTSQRAAERELRRAQGVVASRIAAAPEQRLDALALAVRALAPGLAAGVADVEPTQGVLDALAAGIPAVPLAHAGRIKHFARHGDRIFGVDESRELVIWNATSGRLLAKVALALPEPEHVAIDRDGTHAVVCGFDPIGQVIDLDTFASRTFTQGSHLEACAFLRDGQVISAAEAVQLRDPRTLAVTASYPLPGLALGMAVADDDEVAVATQDGSLWLWHPGHPAAVHRTTTPLGPLLAIDRDARRVLVVGRDDVVRGFALDDASADPPGVIAGVVLDPGPGRVEALDATGGRLAVTRVQSTSGAAPVTRIVAAGPPRTVAGTARGRAPGTGFAIYDRASAIVLTDPTTDRSVLEIPGGADHDEVAAFGDRLLTADRDGVAFAWDLGAPMLRLGATGEIVALAPRGDVLLAASHDGTARVWRGGHATVLAVGAVITAAAWLADDAIVVGDLDGGVQVFGAFDGQRRSHARLGAPISALAVTDGRIAIATLAGALEIRDGTLATAVTLAAPGPRGAITALAWAPDGAAIAIGGGDGSTRILDPRDGRELASRPDQDPVDEPGDHEGHIQLVYTGSVLLAVRPAGSTLVLDRERLTLRERLEGRLVAVLPDGRLVLALATGALAVRTLGAPHGEVLAGHHSSVLAAAASTDGQRLATADAVGTVRIWTIAQAGAGGAMAAAVAVLGAGGATIPITSVAITDGSHGATTTVAFVGDSVAIGYADGAVRVYPATPAETLAAGCEVLRRFARLEVGYCAPVAPVTPVAPTASDRR